MIIERLRQLGVEIPQGAVLELDTGMGFFGTRPMLPMHSIKVDRDRFIDIGEVHDGSFIADVHGEFIEVFPAGLFICRRGKHSQRKLF